MVRRSNHESGFSTGKPYVFEGKNGKRVATDQYVVCQYGTVKKEYQFQFLSNQRFTDVSPRSRLHVSIHH